MKNSIFRSKQAISSQLTLEILKDQCQDSLTKSSRLKIVDRYQDRKV